VPFGGAVTLQGVLSGTGNGGRSVALQERPFPYTAAWRTIANPQVTSSAGAFAFPLLNAITTTQYRVVTTAGTRVTSAIVTLGVAVRVRTRVSSTRVRRGSRVRFSGTVTPPKVGAVFAVQRRTTTGRWVTVATGGTRAGTRTSSRFARRVRVRRTSTYRVFVGVADGYQVSALGREVRVRVRR
jgi:hypothetical protein